MSVEAMTWAFEQPLAGNHKVVLLVLANCTDDERGICFPSVRHIAEKAYTSERTVIRVLSDLEEGGYLTRQERYDENGRQRSSIYRLSMSVSVRKHPPLYEVGVTDCQGGGCQLVRGEGDTVVRGEGDNCVTPLTQRRNRKKEGSKDTVVSLEAATRKKGSRLSEDWRPDEAFVLKARAYLDEGGLEEEFIKFQNYWLSKAGKDGVKLDWNRTYLNWIINSTNYRSTTRRSTHGQNGSAESSGLTREQWELYERHLVR